MAADRLHRSDSRLAISDAVSRSISPATDTTTWWPTGFAGMQRVDHCRRRYAARQTVLGGLTCPKCTFHVSFAKHWTCYTSA